MYASVSVSSHMQIGLKVCVVTNPLHGNDNRRKDKG